MLDLIESRPSAQLDLLFVGGTVIDPETGLHGIRNVGISGDRIAYLGRETPAAKRVEDISGLILAPGFIDLHSHSQQANGHRLQALDGVTSALELEAGTLPVRVAYETMEREGRVTNFGFSASWAAAKIQVMVGVENDDPTNPVGGSFGKYVAHPHFHSIASDEQLARIVALLEEGVREGALGLGVLLGYAAESGRVEMYEIARLAERLGVMAAVHVRSLRQEEPLSNVEAVLEFVASAAGTGAHLHMCHLNSTSAGLIDTALDIMQAAQDQGLRVTAEFYPYTSGSSAIGSLDPTSPRVLGGDITDTFFVPGNRRFSSLEDLTQQQAKDPAALFIAPYLDENEPAQLAKLFHAMTFPGLAVASDAMPLTSIDGSDPSDVANDWPVPPVAAAHPRTAGCFSRVLRWGVRETGIFSWDEAIRRCSLIPARILEETAPVFKKKGRVQLGMDADLVVFDPDTVTDRAEYGRLAPSEGYAWVLVNGVPVVKDSTLIEGVAPGRALKSRFATE